MSKGILLFPMLRVLDIVKEKFSANTLLIGE